MRALIAAGVLALAACGGEEVDVSGVLELEGDHENGGTIFAQRCADCHGDDGLGSLRAPAIDEHVPGMGDEELADVIMNGAGPWLIGMPPQSDLSDQECADVIAHLRVMFPSAD